ncbi:hypothetical protein ACFWIJ_17040 [Streptomyces sp. NPDC127079]
MGRQAGRAERSGVGFGHATPVDDPTRLADSEIHVDATATTCAA